MKKMFLFFSLFLFTFCNSSLPKESSSQEKDNREISYKNFFTLNLDFYHVFVYLDGCLACRDSKLRIKEKEESLHIYSLNFSTIDINIKGKESNIGKNDIFQVRIYQVPHLFYIENHVILKEWIGSEAISSYLFF